MSQECSCGGSNENCRRCSGLGYLNHQSRVEPARSGGHELVQESAKSQTSSTTGDLQGHWYKMILCTPKQEGIPEIPSVHLLPRHSIPAAPIRRASSKNTGNNTAPSGLTACEICSARLRPKNVQRHMRVVHSECAPSPSGAASQSSTEKKLRSSQSIPAGPQGTTQVRASSITRTNDFTVRVRDLQSRARSEKRGTSEAAHVTLASRW